MHLLLRKASFCRHRTLYPLASRIWKRLGFWATQTIKNTFDLKNPHIMTTTDWSVVFIISMASYWVFAGQGFGVKTLLQSLVTELLLLTFFQLFQLKTNDSIMIMTFWETSALRLLSSLSLRHNLVFSAFPPNRTFLFPA